jgi:hypothetical protein
MNKEKKKNNCIQFLIQHLKFKNVKNYVIVLSNKIKEK